MSENHTDRSSIAYMTKLVVDLESRVEELEKQREQRKVLWTRPTPPAEENGDTEIEKKEENGKHENGVGKDITLDLEVQNATTTPGQNVYATGNLPELGSWASNSALKFTTTSETYPTWNAKVTVHDYKGDPIQFKFFKMTDNNESGIQWDNHSGNYTITPSDNSSKQSFSWSS